MFKLYKEVPTHNLDAIVQSTILEAIYTAPAPEAVIGKMPGTRITAFKDYPDALLVEIVCPQQSLWRFLYLVPGHQFFFEPDPVDWRAMEHGASYASEALAKAAALIAEDRKAYTARSLPAVRSRAREADAFLAKAEAALEPIALAISQKLSEHWSFPDEPFQSRAWLLVDD
jgi:hypothetical protein